MKLTRFEFGEVGFFHATDLLHESPDLSEEERRDLEWAEKEFQVCLEEPSCFLEEENPRERYCFFTPEGLERFKDCLDIMCNLFYELEEAGLGEVVEMEVDSDSARVIWQDDFQAVVRLFPHEMRALREGRTEKDELDYNNVDNKLLAGTEGAM